MTYGADSGSCAAKELWRFRAMTFETRIVIRVAFDARLCFGSHYIRSHLRGYGVAVRASPVCLRQAMVFVFEGRRGPGITRPSSLSCRSRTNATLLAARLCSYHLH